MKTAVIIQARMGSSRLPGKVLRRICGESLLAHLVLRLRSQPVGELVVATTLSPGDEAIVEECSRLGIVAVRGSEDDVLSRYELAAKKVGADRIFRITADCPLLEPGLLPAMLEELEEASLDYLTNSPELGLPLGQSVEVFTRDALSLAVRCATERYQREHVTPYLYEETGRCRSKEVGWPKALKRTWPEDLSHHRWTVDTKEDLELVSRIIQALYKPGEVFGIQEVVDLLDAHPAWMYINSEIRQKGFREAG
ncbi:MAG: NTP transferase domain-containing protein [Myxococcales bacterium]|nr:NTP transferase domain-containing protein [Myxococcales bacterium]